MKRFIAAFALSSIPLLAGVASAQELNLATVSAQRPNVVYLRTGMEHGFIASVGYDRVFGVRDRVLVLGVELGVPIVQPDTGNYEMRLGLMAPLVAGHGWALSARIGPTVRWGDNPTASVTSLDLEASLLGGYYARRGFIALEAGVDWAAVSQMKFHQAYRDQVYAGARDGYYGNTGGTFRAGLQGGISLGRVDLVARVGAPFNIDFSMQHVPYYATLGFRVGF
jgi:hypothetical protein